MFLFTVLVVLYGCALRNVCNVIYCLVIHFVSMVCICLDPLLLYDVYYLRKFVSSAYV
jgi:hypothetical protein